MSSEFLMARKSLRRNLAFGLAAAALLLGGAGGWATTAPLSGAVIAPGVLVVDSSAKKVQHPTGGVIGELRVRDGDRVKAGDVVARLDETVTLANLSVVLKSLDEMRARQARVEAERDGANEVLFPEALLSRAGDVETARTMEGERKLFETRRAARQGQKAQLRERIGQLQKSIQGLRQQTSAKTEEIALIQRELGGVRQLWEKQLIQIQRLTALEREAARLGGEQGLLTSSVAQARGRITETELQVLQVDQDLQTEVGKELAEIRSRIGELVERQVAAEDQLKRIDIRAPQDGVVHQLAVHTVGGVIGSGETMMLIIPDSDALEVELRIEPRDIAQLRVGQRAVLRFTAFNQRTTPEINGETSRISADLTTDPRTGAHYYSVRIGLPRGEVARLGDQKLIPGMPVEAFVQTRERTFLSYLVKPISDHVSKAFREDR